MAAKFMCVHCAHAKMKIIESINCLDDVNKEHNQNVRCEALLGLARYGELSGHQRDGLRVKHAREIRLNSLVQFE